MDEMEVLGHAPLIAPEEAAKWMKVAVTTTRHRFARLRTKGLVTYRLTGVAGHREQRWVFTPKGAVEHFSA